MNTGLGHHRASSLTARLRARPLKVWEHIKIHYLHKLLQCFGLCWVILKKTSNARILKDCSDSMTESLLPLDLILEILKRLPVKSLSRCKCVCKLWHSAIQQRHFIVKYMIHNGKNPRFQENASEASNLYCCSDGLVVEGSSTQDKLILRNPATGQKVKLPDPHKGAIHMQFSYIRTIETYKLVHVHAKKGLENGGCKVLTLGTDPAWRSIDIPSLYSLGSPQEKCCARIINEVFYMSRFMTADSGVPELIYLQLASERFGHMEAPPVIFKNPGKVSILWWENKLSLAYHADEELHFWILQKQKWAERTIPAPLSLLEKHPDLRTNLLPNHVYQGVMHYYLANGYHIEFDIASKEVVVTAPPPGKKVVSFNYISFVTIPERPKLRG